MFYILLKIFELKYTVKTDQNFQTVRTSVYFSHPNAFYLFIAFYLNYYMELGTTLRQIAQHIFSYKIILIPVM